jgi:glyoxylase-like metal-dependent hydrolase (beta-lactamase superfamily II)
MEWKIIPTGRVWIDPGGAFGLVPRKLWINYQKPTEDQLIPMDQNSLLIRSEGKTILVDSGYGDKLDEKSQRWWAMEWPEGTLVDNLKKEGVSTEDVDIVINTHLHSDHCGGNTIFKDGKAVPAFPKAQYLVQRQEWEDATHPNVRTKATYLPENLLPVEESGQLKLLDGDTKITKEVRTAIARGHTPGFQLVILAGGEEPVVFIGDMASYAVHFARTAWVTAYDVEPLETIKSKEKWQPWAAENRALLVFQHDCTTRTARLQETGEGRYKIEKLSAGSLGE